MTFNGLQFCSIHRDAPEILNKMKRVSNTLVNLPFEQEIHISKDYTVQVYQVVSISILSCGDKASWANREPRIGYYGSSGTYDLGKGCSWIIDISVWLLHSVEGRTLVFGQRDTILEAKWQVRLEI